MTKYEKELRELNAEELVNRFDDLCTTITCEVNSRRGQTKKTTTNWELCKKELIRRMSNETDNRCYLKEEKNSCGHGYYIKDEECYQCP